MELEGAKWEYIEALQEYLQLHVDKKIYAKAVSMYYTGNIHYMLMGQIINRCPNYTVSIPLNDLSDEEILEEVVKILKEWKLVPIEDHVRNS